MDYDLECDSVRKSFGDLIAVDDVSFNIPSGSFFSILGDVQPQLLRTEAMCTSSSYRF